MPVRTQPIQKLLSDESVSRVYQATGAACGIATTTVFPYVVESSIGPYDIIGTYDIGASRAYLALDEVWPVKIAPASAQDWLPQYRLDIIDSPFYGPAAPFREAEDSFTVSINPYARTFAWLKPTLQAVARLASARVESGYLRTPAKASAAREMLSFLATALPPDAAAPSLAPLENGGLQADWHRGGIDVEVLVSSDPEERGVYVREKATGMEFEFDLDPRRFAELIGRRLAA